MLDRAGDSCGYIKVGTDHTAGLTDLMLMVDPAGVHCRARGAYRSSDRMREVADEREVRRFLQTAAAGDDDVGFGNRNLAGLRSLRLHELSFRVDLRDGDGHHIRRCTSRLLRRN